MAKNKKWIQAASASIKKRGTAGVCTGDKFGGPTCPRGSKRYNLAKVFKGMAKKKKKAAWGAMIHAKDSKYIQKKTTPNNPRWPKGYDPSKQPDPKWWRKMKSPEEYKAEGGILKAKKSKYVKGNVSKTAAMEDAYTKSKKKLTRKEKIKIMTGPIPREFLNRNRRLLHSDPRMLRQGGILHAKTSAFAETHAANWAKRRAAATTGMKAATAGTAYKSPGWINKNLNKLKDMMKLGSKTTSMGAGLSKYTSKIPKASQLKTLTKAGGRRSLMLMGGPMGAAAAAATLTPSLIDKLTKRAPGAKKTKLFGIDIKGAEKSARAREALMAKRNKARNAQTGAMIRATHGVEVLGKQSVPFESQGATANLAAERQGRKGAAVRGFNFKGVF